jgi:hypothetical protein
MQVPHMTGDAVPMPADPGSPPPESSLVLAGAYLLTEDSNGQLAVPSLTLVLDPAGLTVLKPDGQAGAAVTWNDMSALNATGRMRTPTGHPGVVVEAVTSARTHRFMVPADDPDRLEREIARVVGIAGPRRRRRRRGGSGPAARQSWWRPRSR